MTYKDNAEVQDLTKQNYGVVVLYAQWKKSSSASNTTVSKTKLSSTNLKVKKGKTVKLKLLNNTKKVTWKITSGKKYISLKNKSVKGVTIKGLKKGKGKVQAVIGKNKYTCTINVIS